MSGETLLLAVWLLGWAGATIYAAAVIGNIKNGPHDKGESFPTFIVPLVFGWLWPVFAPVFAALVLIVSPLAWLSDRATVRQKDPQP